MAEGIDFANETVIVVDDETFSLSIVTRLCRSIGFKDVKSEKSATDGLAALRTLATTARPFIICDFRMPEHNGLEVLKAVRMGLVHSDRTLPVLMLTGHTDADLVALAMKLDVDAFIAKPVSRDALERRLEQVAKMNRTVKDIDYYGSIPTYVASIEETKEPVKEEDKGRVVTLDQLKEGDKLAAPIKLAGNGQVLIEYGEVINDRLIARLNDLHEMGSELEEIRIY